MSPNSVLYQDACVKRSWNIQAQWGRFPFCDRHMEETDVQAFLLCLPVLVGKSSNPTHKNDLSSETTEGHTQMELTVSCIQIASSTAEARGALGAMKTTRKLWTLSVPGAHAGGKPWYLQVSTLRRDCASSSSTAPPRGGRTRDRRRLFPHQQC